MTKDEALDLALEALEGYCEHGAILRPLEVRDAIKQARSAPVQVFDHVNAARQGLRDAQNRSRQISNLINCGTCGYPLAPEERTSLIERDGVMVKPAPVQELVAWLVEFENGEQELHFDKQSVGETQAPLYTTPPAAQRQWVGLTDAEVDEAARYCVKSGQSVNAAIRAIEAKLRSKNNDS